MTHMDTCVCLGVILEMKIIFLKLLIILRFLTYHTLRNIELIQLDKRNIICSIVFINILNHEWFSVDRKAFQTPQKFVSFSKINYKLSLNAISYFL